MHAVIIIGAKYLIGLPVLALLYYLFVLRGRARRKVFILSVISLPLVYLLGRFSGYFFYDPRPFVVGRFVPLIPHAADNGFPSDHTLLAAGIASVVLMFNRPFGIFLWLLVVLIGAARVLAGVHHTIDIVGAALIAFIVVVCVFALLKRTAWYNR